jgi:phosphoglycerate dehydrogenase-like enzyme
MSAAIAAAGAVMVAPEDAEAIVWTAFADPAIERLLELAARARWVQLPSIGIDFAFDAVRARPDVVWTCAKESTFAPLAAEHALALLLATQRGLPHSARARSWDPRPMRTLDGAEVGILGGGGIGAALARLLSPLGVSTTIVRRSLAPVPHAARVLEAVDLPLMLERSDAVVLAAPLTAETYGVIDAAALARMPSHAWLVNVGRGGLVDTNALVTALAAGRPAGAALDVTDPEPLPDGHPLWEMDNVLLTPHVAVAGDMADEALARLVADNLKRWGEGRRLLGVVNPDSNY